MQDDIEHLRKNFKNLKQVSIFLGILSSIITIYSAYIVIAGTNTKIISLVSSIIFTILLFVIAFEASKQDSKALTLRNDCRSINDFINSCFRYS